MLKHGVSIMYMSMMLYVSLSSQVIYFGLDSKFPISLVSLKQEKTTSKLNRTETSS